MGTDGVNDSQGHVIEKNTWTLHARISFPHPIVSLMPPPVKPSLHPLGGVELVSPSLSPCAHSVGETGTAGGLPQLVR